MMISQSAAHGTCKAASRIALPRRCQITAPRAAARRQQVASYQAARQPQIDWQQLRRAVVGTAAAVALTLGATGPAAANGGKVAEFAASGLIFKDSVEVVAIPDPDVDGVVIFISDFKRSLADKLAKDFFSEPSQASVTCAATGPIMIKNEGKVKANGGQEVFTEQKGLNLFQAKTTRVRRIYDAEHNALLYVSYSTRLTTSADEGGVSTGRYRTSICALPIIQPAAPMLVAVPAEVPAAVQVAE